MYALLTGVWPLRNATTGRSLPPVPRDEHGVPVAPAELRYGVPLSLSNVTMAALGADDDQPRVYTAGALARLLAAERERPARRVLPSPDAIDHEVDLLWRPAARATASRPARRTAIVVAGLVALVCLLLGYLGVQAWTSLGLSGPGPSPFVVPDGSPPSGGAAVRSRATGAARTGDEPKARGGSADPRR